VTIRTYAEFASDLPKDEIERDGDFLQYPGKSVTAAVRAILAGLGCGLEPLEYLHERGWEFAFAYRGRRIVCRLTLIWRYLAIFEDLHGSKAADHPDFVEIMERLAEALAADPRFADVGWFHRDGFEPHETASAAPGAKRPTEGLPTPGPELIGEPWSDFAPHPVRRWVARAFDSYLTTGVLFAVPVVLWIAAGRPEAWLATVGMMGLVYVLSPLRGLVTAILNALLLSAFGVTPGKWLCGVRVARRDGAPLTFGTALKRELAAFILGCGLYLPLIGLAAMAIGFANLSEKGATSWDADRDLLVLQRPNSAGQFALTSFAFALLLVVVGAIAVVAVEMKGAASPSGG
jgi:uncharacterized RDD family membrane protein YckC